MHNSANLSKSDKRSRCPEQSIWSRLVYHTRLTVHPTPPLHCGVRRLRNRKVGIALTAWIFEYHAGAWVLLAGEILELCNSGVGVLVRIVNHGRRLIDGTLVRAVLEMQRAIRQASITVLKILIHRACKDQFPEAHLALNIRVASV